MTKLYEWKDKIVRFHAEYEIYMTYIYKFILGLALFAWINGKIGFMEQISSFPVTLVLALVCCLLPKGVMLFVAAALVTLHLNVLSLEVAVAALLIFAMIFFVYFRFAPQDGLLVVLTPVLHAIGIPYVVTIGTGLLRKVYSVAAVICGTIVFYFVEGIHQNVLVLQMTEANDNVDVIKATISVEQLLSNKEVYLTLVVFALVTMVVHMIRKMNIEHAWRVSIFVGSLLQISGLLAGYLILDIQGRWILMIIGSVLSIFLALGLEFFFMDLDYTRTERVQFEDDEYYYYVKAVPKRNVTITEKSITQFAGASHFGKKKQEKVIRKRDIVDELGIDEEDLK